MVLLYIPPVQNLLRREVTAYASKATGMQIQVERIDLRGSHTAAGYFIVFGKPECSRTGMAVIKGKSRSGRCHFESGGG